MRVVAQGFCGLFEFDRAISMKSGLRPAVYGCSGIVSGAPNALGCGTRWVGSGLAHALTGYRGLSRASIMLAVGVGPTCAIGCYGSNKSLSCFPYISIDSGDSMSRCAQSTECTAMSPLT